jgi:uncharacterized protein YbjT (DUF2867 family)
MSEVESNGAVLILGGNGKTGRRVAERLKARGRAVKPVSRSTAPRFDWTDQSTWPGVLDGVGSIYITYQPDLAVPGAVEAVQAFAELALRAGIKRMVLLSGRGEEEAERAEDEFKASGADWTIVRAGWFFQNFSESFLMDGIQAGEVILPKTTAKEPFIDADDIADVVVEALSDDRHIGELYEVTGQRLLTFADAFREIGEVSGRPIAFTEVSAEDYAAALRQAELPEEMIGLVLYLFTTILDGRNAHVTDGVERALGRAPRDFADYARDVAGAGAWAA